MHFVSHSFLIIFILGSCYELFSLARSSLIRQFISLNPSFQIIYILINFVLSIALVNGKCPPLNLKKFEDFFFLASFNSPFHFWVSSGLSNSVPHSYKVSCFGFYLDSLRYIQDLLFSFQD